MLAHAAQLQLVIKYGEVGDSNGNNSTAMIRNKTQHKQYSVMNPDKLMTYPSTYISVIVLHLASSAIVHGINRFVIKHTK